MRVVHTSTMRREYAETLNQVIYLKERIILERHGKKIAAIIPMDDFNELLKNQNNTIEVSGILKHKDR